MYYDETPINEPVQNYIIALPFNLLLLKMTLIDFEKFNPVVTI